MTRLADAALHLARGCGLFALARTLTADRLRILCYHGVALDDEFEFQPMLFMRAATFADRLDRLLRTGYPVLPLDEALDRLRQGTLPRAAVVITIDDGWYGTLSEMAPALAHRGLAATLYLATYYVEKQTQVFNVAAAYALWRAQSRTLDLGGVDPGLAGRFDLSDPAHRSRALEELRTRADDLDSADERQALLERLYGALGLDFERVRRQRMFTFMSPDEAATLPSKGVELQLHTHRHRFPGRDTGALAEEIEANRAALSRVAAGPFRHLCYPSGEYDRSAFPQLAALGIASATTTLPGMNDGRTPPFELRRFLDSETCSAIRFEAEVSGFLELVRGALGSNRVTR
jgi:peptidoglycan/xylan/chitin deacetylase (PgdA/CDA1 family)